ncbi:MAG: cytochrome b/b6 domain-containing protein [Acidihalobacter sp.]
MMTSDQQLDGGAADLSDEGPSLLTRTLHWLMALLVVFQGLLGYANLHVGWFLHHEMAGIVLHQEVGLAILFVAVWMMLQRLIEGRRSGHGLSSMQARLAGIVHAALYLLILAESFLGIWIMGLTGAGLSFLFWHIGLPIAPDPQLVYSGGLMQIHAFIAGTLATLIVGHAAAALHHHVVLGDDVLRRMLLWKPQPRQPERRRFRAPATPVTDAAGDR